MVIIKVWIDEEVCTGCGICEDTCPEIFELNDVVKVKEKADFNEFEEKIKEAVEDCPNEAIHLEEK